MSKSPLNPTHNFSQFVDPKDYYPHLSKLHRFSLKKQFQVIKNVIIKGRNALKIKKWRRIIKKYILCTLRNGNNVKFNGINTSDLPSNQYKYSSNTFDDDMEEPYTNTKYIYNNKTYTYKAESHLDIFSLDYELFINVTCSPGNQSLFERMDEGYNSDEEIPRSDSFGFCQMEESQTNLVQREEYHINPPYSVGGCRDSELGDCD